MKITTDVQKDEFLDPDNVSECLTKVIEVMREHNLRVPELIIFLSNLGYSIGASIDGKAKSVEELQKEYYSNPTIGVSLMLNAVTINTWYDSYVELLKKQKSSDLSDNIFVGNNK